MKAWNAFGVILFIGQLLWLIFTLLYKNLKKQKMRKITLLMEVILIR